MQHDFKYDKEKNLILKAERNISFEDVINAIYNDKLLDVIPHHNKKAYPNQKIMVIDIKNYVYLVPYVEEANYIFLKTIFPSRKFTKLYLNGGKS